MLRRLAAPVLAGALAVLPLLAAAAPGAATQAAPPPHDDFADAIAVDSLPFVDKDRDVRGATWAAPDPDYACRSVDDLAPVDQTVWYAFTPAADTRVTIDTFGSADNTVVAVWTGARGELTEVACNDDAATTVQSRAEFAVAAGTTYFFQVALWLEGGSGTLAFAVRDASAPDATPPEPPAVTLEESEPDQHAAGATLFCNPAGNGGTFTATSSTADEEPGVAAVAFPPVCDDATTDTMPSTVEEAAAGGAASRTGAAFAAPAAWRAPTYEATPTRGTPGRTPTGSSASGPGTASARRPPPPSPSDPTPVPRWWPSPPRSRASASRRAGP